MYYDYKNILNVDDIYIPNDPSSSLIKNSSLYSIKDPSLLYKKNISAYLIMKKITLKKTNPHKYRLLKEKLSKRQEKEPFLDEKSFIKREENIQDTVLESQKPMLKSSIKKPFQKNQDYEENIVISEPDLRGKAFSIPILIPQTLKPENNKVRSNSIKKKKKEFQKETKKKNSINKDQNDDPKSKTFKTSPREISKNNKKSSKKNKKKPFRLKVPKHQRAMMQDFNDYYSHYSEDDKEDLISLVSQENSSEQMNSSNKSLSEKELTQEKNTLEDLSKNFDLESEEDSENSLNTEEENDEEIDDNAEENTKIHSGSDGVHLSLKKEVSFQPGNEKIDTPRLSPKKSRSMNRSRTISKGNSSQESSEKKESLSKTRENTHFFPTQPNNPYIGLIEKLLESNDLFSEDIEGMMGIKQPDIVLPEHLNSLGEVERKIYEKVYKWNFQMEALLKKDGKEIRKYQKKLDNMFISQKESEEPEESGSEEIEEGEEN